MTGIKSGVLSWTLLGLMGLAMLLLLFAAVAHFVAWIGAVLNTAQLPDKTWFVVLLVVGLLGLVFIATVAYVIAGPDGVKAKEEASALPPAGGVPQVPPSTMSGTVISSSTWLTSDSSTPCPGALQPVDPASRNPINNQPHDQLYLSVLGLAEGGAIQGTGPSSDPPFC